MKFIIGLLIILLIESRECKTMSWGNLRPRNLLLFDQFFHHKKLEDGISVKTLNFSSQHGSLIAIHVTDLTLQQDGGCVRIVYGGIGFNFVRLQLLSEVNKQLLLNIEIFGS